MLFSGNFRIMKIVPTIGRTLRTICRIYDVISQWRGLAGLLSSFILWDWRALGLENPWGNYRFFVARKPANEETEDGRPEAGERGLGEEQWGMQRAEK
jgi:hypothetical protein